MTGTVSPLVGCGGVAAPSASSSSHRRPGGSDRANPDYRTCRARTCRSRHLPASELDVTPGTRRRGPTTWCKRARPLVCYQPAPRFLMVHSATEERRGFKHRTSFASMSVDAISTTGLWGAIYLSQTRTQRFIG